MGWTVYYQGEADSPITDDERELLAGHVAEWSPQLDEGSEPYAWREEADGRRLVGFTKIQSSADDQGDFVTLIRATQDLEQRLPRFKFLVSDDYVVTESTPPSEVEPE